MSFLPPVVMEIRANAAQFLATQEKVAASAKATAAATISATEKAAAASRTATAEATAAADKRIAADARAAEAHRKATQMQADSLGVMTAKEQAAYDKQAAAAKKAANEAELAAAKEVSAKGKATTATAAYAKAQADAEQAARRANSMVGQLTQSANDHSKAWSTAGVSMLGFGVAALAGVGAVVKAYAEFDKQMSSVQAATHATGGEMTQLRDLAVEAGAVTAYSAKEAAQGIEEMSKAGVSTTDIMKGGLTGSLSLAAAGSMEVADAAELAATALVQFKMSGDKVPHVADLLSAGAGKAQGSVSDLGMALKQSGLIASSTGLSIEETTGGLAAFASAGLLGSDAGTSFKTMLQSLTPNSAAAATEMNRLGINAYDQQGKFIGLSKFAGNLQDSMKGLSDEQRNASMKIIFGSDAVRAANVLYEQGAKGISEWTDKVNDAGYAATTAGLMQNNLAGDVEKLGGSMDSVFLKSGAGVNEVLRHMAQNAGDLVNNIGQIPGPMLQASLGLTAVAGGAALAGGAFLTIFPKVMDAKKSFDDLKDTSPKLASGLGKVGKAAGVAAGTLAALQVAGAISKSWGGETKTVEDYAQAFLNLKTSTSDLDNVVKNTGGLGTQINGVGDALVRVNDFDWYDNLNNWAGDLAGGTSRTQEFRDSVKGLDGQLGTLVQNGGAQKAGESFKTLAEEADKSAKAQGKSGMSTGEVLKLMPEYEAGLKKQATALGVKLSQSELEMAAMGKIPQVMLDATKSTEKFTDATGQVKPISPELEKSLDDAGVSANGLATDLEKVLDGMLATGMATLNTRDATTKFNKSNTDAKTALDDLKKANVDVSNALNKTGTDFDFGTASGQQLNAKFQEVMRSGVDLAKSMAGPGVDAQAKVQGAMQSTYDSMIAAADGMGISGDKAIDLTRSVLQIPPGVDIKTWIDQYAKQEAEKLKATIDGVPKDIPVTVHIYNTQAIQDAWNAVSALQAHAQDASQAILHVNSMQQANQYANGNAYGSGNGTPGGFTGGAVDSIMGFAGGGMIPGSPPSRANVDNILAMVNGRPLKVRSGEFINNEPSTKMNLPWLKASNAGMDLGQTMQGQFAAGYVTAQSQPAMAAPSQSNPNVTIYAQTNASASHIASEVGWALRTK